MILIIEYRLDAIYLHYTTIYLHYTTKTPDHTTT